MWNVISDWDVIADILTGLGWSIAGILFWYRGADPFHVCACFTLGALVFRRRAK